MTALATFPRFRAVADQAILVEFAETADTEAYAQVLSLDVRLAQLPFVGFLESVPALVSLLVRFDALCIDHLQVERALTNLMQGPILPPRIGKLHIIEVCYEPKFGPDLGAVSQQTGLSEDAVIDMHQAQTYQVFMYGFAPGYAYLSGVSTALQLPRKAVAQRDVAAGSIIIAGAQCLITTLTMPTGWWNLGRTAAHILTGDSARPFLFDVGDQVRFKRVDHATFEASSAKR